MPPKRKHQQQAAETEHKAAAPLEDQQQGKGVKEDEQQEAKASEEKAKEEEEGVGQRASSPKKEEEDRKEEEEEEEQEEEQDAPELKRRRVSFQEPQKEKEEERGGDEVVAKEEEENRNVLQEEEEGEAQPFEFAWDHFTGLLEGDGAGFTGAEPNVSVCDEPVDEALVRAGLELLNAATGPWHEDADEGRRRTKQVVASGGDYSDSVARVYRASSPSAEPLSETDRYELTFLQCPGFAAHFEYVFLADKVKRRYVFVGEAGAHPQAGTNDFVYDNSDGSGPGLLPDSSVPPTPTTLLDAARQRFSEFCLDHHH